MLQLDGGDGPEPPPCLFQTTPVRKGRVPHCQPRNPAGMKVMSPHSALSVTTPERELGHWAWQGWKSRLPIQPLLVVVRVDLLYFPWCSAGGGQFCLNIFCLGKLFFFWPFGYKEQAFLAPLPPHYTQVADFPSTQSRIYKRKPRNSSLCDFLGLGIPSWSFSSPLF